MTFAIFGALVLERPPLLLSDAGNGFLTWLRIAGGFAALGVLCFVIARAISGGRRPVETDRSRLGGDLGSIVEAMKHVDTSQYSKWVRPAFITCALLALITYVALAVLWFPQIYGYLKSAAPGETEPPSPGKMRITFYGLSIAGGFALLAAMMPFFNDAARLSGRRIWGLAKLSYKEAVRKRILYVFLFLILVGLFMSWFVQSKPEDQLRTYVQVVYWAMTPLLLLSAGLLAALSIPTDIKQQTMHTITTKPVERFEIVAGRFLGYYLLMSVALLVTTTASLFFVLRGLNPKAERESLKARDPMYGRLYFVDETDKGEEKISTGTNVGRVWGYRSYLQGPSRHKADTQYAVWLFDKLPEDLDDRTTIACELTFDVYRTHKGRENVAPSCTLQFETWQFNKENREEYKTKLRADDPSKSRAEYENELSREYGYWEQDGVAIVDYHTRTLRIPVGLFRNALAEDDNAGERRRLRKDQWLLRVRARNDSDGQLIGTAQYDLYLRRDDPERGSDTLDFIWNFFKGALGLWLRIGLVIGLCVALSTRLGGIISFLFALLIYLGGVFRAWIWEVVTGRNPGGGATEAAYRLFTRTKVAQQLDEESTTTSVIRGADTAMSWVLTAVLYLMPDVDHFDFTDKVANGFNVGLVSQDFLPALLVLIGYLIPWGLLAYYVIKAREIAGPQ